MSESRSTTVLLRQSGGAPVRQHPATEMVATHAHALRHQRGRHIGHSLRRSLQLMHLRPWQAGERNGVRGTAPSTVPPKAPSPRRRAAQPCYHKFQQQHCQVQPARVRRRQSVAGRAPRHGSDTARRETRTYSRPQHTRLSAAVQRAGRSACETPDNTVAVATICS